VVAQELFLLIAVMLLGGVAQGAVIRSDPLPGLAIPLDADRSWRGHRLFGDNKTVRGVIVMVSATTVAATVLLPLAPPVSPAPWYGWTGLGALMGIAYLLAELPNSFVKRRLGIDPGDHGQGWRRAVQYLVDQSDSVIGVALLLWWVLALPADEVVILAVVGVGVHAAFDVALHRFGVKGGVTRPGP